MTAHRILLAGSLLLAGCPIVEDLTPDGGSCAMVDMIATNADMTAPAPKCAAAKGLAGDNLLCVDFDKVTQLTDPALANWNFNANMANCWQISSGMLQVQGFGGFSGNCGVTLPPIDFKLPANASYQRATLSLIHKVDMSDLDQQQAQVYVDTASPTRLVHEMTGRPTIPSLISTTFTVNKADLPSGLQSVYKFFLNVSAPNAASGRQGWQIQSIAVNATP
jgi:hypothetical protein